MSEDELSGGYSPEVPFVRQGGCPSSFKEEKADKGKASLEEPSKKARADKSLELLEAGTTLTRLRIRPQELSPNSEFVPEDAFGADFSEADPIPSTAASKKLGPVYRGGPIQGRCGMKSPLMKSLAKGLKGHPLTAITNLLPEDYTRGEGRLTPAMFVDKLVFEHYASTLRVAGWYDDFHRAMSEYPDESGHPRELSKPERASGSRRVPSLESPSSEVGNLRLLLATKEQELLESKQKNTELSVANSQLQELLDVATEKNRELVEHAKEVDICAQRATKEHFRVLEDLNQIRTSKEGFRELCGTLENAVSRAEGGREKAEADLRKSREKCNGSGEDSISGRRRPPATCRSCPFFRGFEI
ncbi:uncharacterized protein LOC133854495 [Alnus glutinosa]|uniref:uncharacterized protein LOC133854495 n=1 Tax=Alnus glutinosa TaxID=3517 RepID=UPI002D77AA5C|nr:uncharacterized protein LOC133854495 [Alnus glutinosa]